MFTRLHAAKPDAVTAGVVNWKHLNSDILRPATVQHTHEEDDSAVISSSVQLLKEQDRLDLLFVHLDAVDLAGHTYDYGPNVKEYVDSIKEADSRIRTLLETLFYHRRSSFPAEDWLVVLTTDHGGIDYTHEDGRWENRTNFLILHGSDVIDGEIFPAPLVVDLAPTVLAHTGVKIQSAWHLDGRPVGIKCSARRDPKTGRREHFLCLQSSQDPENKFPIPPEELEDGPAPDVQPEVGKLHEQKVSHEAK